jgi:hypothetical protein
MIGTVPNSFPSNRTNAESPVPSVLKTSREELESEVIPGEAEPETRGEELGSEAQAERRRINPSPK